MHLERLKWSMLIFTSVLVIGITAFMKIENLSFLDAVYVSVVTLATVGYGDIVPKTPLGRGFTILYIIIGVGAAYYTFILVVTMIIEGNMKDILGRKGMERQIANLNNHIIVCGAGKVGSNVVRRLLEEKEKFVVIEKDVPLFEQLVDQRVLAINGDATMDEVLLEAGLDRAKGVITALSHDADNVYVTLTAKSLNPNANIVARAERPVAEEKLRRAGANTVIFPSVMGGRQLVSAMTKPVIMDFVENLFYNQDLHMDIAEITISPFSELVGQSFIESGIKDRFDSIVIAIKRGGRLITNPSATEIMQDGDVLIVLGKRDPLSELNGLAQRAVLEV